MFDRDVVLEEGCFGEYLSARRAREYLVAEREKRRRIRRGDIREPVFGTGFRVGLYESDEGVLRRSSGGQSR